jgi:hypothetical protein
MSGFSCVSLKHQHIVLPQRHVGDLALEHEALCRQLGDQRGFVLPHVSEHRRRGLSWDSIELHDDQPPIGPQRAMQAACVDRGILDVVIHVAHEHQVDRRIGEHHRGRGARDDLDVGQLLCGRARAQVLDERRHDVDGVERAFGSDAGAERGEERSGPGPDVRDRHARRELERRDDLVARRDHVAALELERGGPAGDRVCFEVAIVDAWPHAHQLALAR